MSSCWEILGIERTTDPDIIRKAYLSLLPQYHPESDPEGFKQLRAAYDAALSQREEREAVRDFGGRQAKSSDTKKIVTQFKKLLRSAQRRFQPAEWQRFIADLDGYSFDAIEDCRWPLFWCARTRIRHQNISFSCLKLLSQRLDWGWEGIAKKNPWLWENVQEVLEKIDDGDLFDYSLLSALPSFIQDNIIREYTMLAEAVVISPASAQQMLEIHRVLPVVDDAELLKKIIFWHSYYNEGVLVAVDTMMQQWSGNDSYYFLRDLWRWFRTDGCKKLLLWWYYRHSQAHVPLMIFAFDYYCYPREPIAPGEYKKTKMLCQWALKWMGELTAAERYLLRLMLHGSATQTLADTVGKQYQVKPLWPLYQAVESLMRETHPQDEWLADNEKVLVSDPMTQMIIEALRGQVTELDRYEQQPRCPVYCSEQQETRRMANTVFVMAFFALVLIAIIMNEMS